VKKKFKEKYPEKVIEKTDSAIVKEKPSEKDSVETKKITKPNGYYYISVQIFKDSLQASDSLETYSERFPDQQAKLVRGGAYFELIIEPFATKTQAQNFKATNELSNESIIIFQKKVKTK